MRRTITLCALLASFAASIVPAAGEAEPLPVIRHLFGEAAGPEVRLGQNWLMQKWRETSDDVDGTLCILGLDLGDDRSLNISVDNSLSGSLTIWDRGYLTDAMAPDAEPLLSITGKQTKSMFLPASWEYGVVRVEVGSEFVSLVSETPRLVFSLVPDETRLAGKTSISADLTGFGDALDSLVACASELTQTPADTVEDVGEDGEEPMYAAQSSRTGGAGPVVWDRSQDVARADAQAECAKEFDNCTRAALAVVKEDNLFVTTCCIDAEGTDRCVVVPTPEVGKKGQDAGFQRGSTIIAEAGLPTNQCRKAAVHNVTTGDPLEVQ